MKKYISLFLILIIMLVSLFTPFEVNANPILYPIVEGAMYLTGVAMASFGLTVGNESDSTYSRNTRLSVITGYMKNKIVSTWSEPENALYLSMINSALPGSILDLNIDQYNLLKKMGKTLYDEFTSNPNNIVSVDNALPTGLNPDYYLDHVESGDIKQKDYNNVPLFEVIPLGVQNKLVITYRPSSGSSVIYTDEIYISVEGTVTYKQNIRRTRSSDGQVTNLISSYTNNKYVIGWSIDCKGTSSIPSEGSARYSICNLVLVVKDINTGVISYDTLMDQINLTISIRAASTNVAAEIDTSLEIDDNYEIPSTIVGGVEKKLVKVPTSLSNFGTTVRTVSDVIPKDGDILTPPNTDISDKDKAWWSGILSAVTTPLLYPLEKIGTLVSGFPGVIADALAPATTSVKAIADSMSKVEDSVAEADLTDTIKNFNIPDLFILSLQVILATIRMVGRAIVFIGTVQTIPANGSMVPSNMVLGLNYMKNYDLPVGLSIWDLTNLLIGFLFGIGIFKKVVSNVRR